MRWEHPSGMLKTTQRSVGLRGTYTIMKSGGRMWKLTCTSVGGRPEPVGGSSDSVRDLKSLAEHAESLALPPGTSKG